MCNLIDARWREFHARYLVEFDHLMLKHASTQGARVYDGMQVTEILFDHQRPFAAVCLARGSGETLEIHFKHFRAARESASVQQIYRDAIASCPLISRLTRTGALISEVKVEQDYSYTSVPFTGVGFFMAGDAACFLDPLLSTGVHLAMYSGMLAAASIASLLRGEVTEDQAISYYEQSYRRAYLRFLVFVTAFYENRGNSATSAG